jgi:hypothetical protein
MCIAFPEEFQVQRAAIGPRGEFLPSVPDNGEFGGWGQWVRGPSDAGAKNTAFERDGALAPGKALKGNNSNGWIGF